MDKRTIARIKASENSLNYLLENNSIYQGFVPLEEAVTKNRDVLRQIAGLSDQQNKNTTGTTVVKNEARTQMATIATSLAKKAIVWARKNNRWAEVAILDIEVSDLLNGELQLAISSAQNVLQVLNNNKADLLPYRIKDEQITELENAITAMGNVETAPRQSRDQRQLAGKEISILMKTLDQTMTDIEDLVEGEYRRTNPNFVDGYNIARRIDDPAYRKTLLLVTVKNKEGLPLADAWCDIVEMIDEEQLTNNLGVAEISAIKTGTYQLDISKEGYLTHSTVFTIKRGERKSIEVTLQPMA